jgi:hypothetical protein
MPNDPVVPLDRDKLWALVESKTPWKRAAFQRLMGDKFGEDGTAFLSQKLRARDLIGLPRDTQNKLREIQMAFPTAAVSYIGPIQELPKMVENTGAEIVRFPGSGGAG